MKTLSVLENDLQFALSRFLENNSRASNRMDPIADYCLARLQERQMPGLHGGSSGEKKIRGFGREKNWDVACVFAGQPRILLSLKSILLNVSGTVPNRVDDLMGEVASVQMIRPEIVIGYLAILDLNGTTSSSGPRDSIRNERLFQDFRTNIERLTVRQMPTWNTGLIEAAWLFEIDTSNSEIIIPNVRSVVEAGESFFDNLVRIAREREPNILSP